MHKTLALATALTIGLTIGAPTATHATVTGFVSNPSGNSTDWADFVAGTGASVNTSIDFETHPLGALDGTFYEASTGVTMTIVAPLDGGAAVVDVTGTPSGTIACPCSTGEGAFPLTRALVYADQVTFTVNFATAVSGFGMLTGDHFDPYPDSLVAPDPMTIAAYDGPDGTGTLLGSFDSLHYSFQLGYSYFMGVASTTNEIRSIVFTDGESGTHDGVDLDAFRIAQITAAPEPASLALLLAGAAGAIGLRRRR